MPKLQAVMSSQWMKIITSFMKDYTCMISLEFSFGMFVAAMAPTLNLGIQHVTFHACLS